MDASMISPYCLLQYGKKVAPEPLALAKDLGFDDLVGTNA